MEPLGTAEWLTLIALVITTALAIRGFVVTKRFGNQHHKLQFLVDTTPLVSERTQGRGLVVSYNDEPVQDPHLVQVTLRNIGPNDITSADFDAGSDLEVHVEPNPPHDEPVPVPPGGYILDVLDFRCIGPDGVYDSSIRLNSWPGDAVPISPMLIRRGTSITFDLLVDGPVEVYLKNPLINTDLVRTTPAERSAAVLDAVASGTGSVVLSGPFGAAAAAAAALVNRATVGGRSRDGSRR